MKIILFDGECNFCNWNVRFIINRDPKSLFKFASLQSNAGIQLLKQYRISCHGDSLVLIENGRAYTRSTAALKICRHLTLFWKTLFVFILIPKPIRDCGYHLIAQNRHRFIKDSNKCIIPTIEIKRRFLQ